jgi:AraC-like DNA-binding protein
MLRFVARAYPDRLGGWREVLRRKLLHVSVDPILELPYDAEASLRILPDVRFGWGTIGASVNRRTRHAVAQDNDDFFMIVNLDDSFSVTQRGRDFTLRPGDANVISCAEEALYVRPQAGRILCVRMPREALAPLVPELEDKVATVIRRENETLQLLVRYVRSLDHTQRLPTPAVREVVAKHICDLAALALGASREGTEIAGGRSLNAARLRAVKEFIAANLSRRDLSVATLAIRHRMTERHIQRLFEAEGVTFTSFLLERRLYTAFQSLNDVRNADRGISEIALECGFGDISYFNRAFRRRFGATPSDVRRAKRN